MKFNYNLNLKFINKEHKMSTKFSAISLEKQKDLDNTLLNQKVQLWDS